MPSEKELRDGEVKYRDASFKNPNNLSFWFPIIEDIVPVPKTKFIHTDVNLMSIFDDTEPKGIDLLINDIKSMADRIGYPVFLRSGFTSGKHDWDETCYVKSPEDIKGCVYSIVNYSETHAMFGELPTYTWVVREMLLTDPVFYAFKGMPITKEFRYFIRDGIIEHTQPYWDPKAFENDSQHPNTLPSDWRAQLASISEIGDDSEHLVDLTKVVSKAIKGYWSIDWLWTKKGWYLTDMALGEQSYMWSTE